MKQKLVTRVKDSQDFTATSNEITVLSISWDNLANKTPLCNYKNVRDNYFKPIITMCTEIGIPTDEFYISYFRKAEIKDAIVKYLYKFAHATAESKCRHIIDMIMACSDSVTASDYNDYKKMYDKIVLSNDLFKVSDRKLVEILDWDIVLKEIKRFNNDPYEFLRIVSILFEDGYVLRPAIITETVIGSVADDDLPKVPTLDLTTGRWYIGEWKSHGVDFVLKSSTLLKIRELLGKNHCKYLLTKDGAKPITRRDIERYFSGVIAPNRCRKSFITWYVMSPDRKLEDIVKLSETLGNTVLTMFNKYLGEPRFRPPL